MGMNDISGLVSNYNRYKASSSAGTASTEKAATETQKTEQAAADQKQKQDQLVKGTSTDSVTYNRPSKMTANQMMALEQQRTDSFTKMLQSMVVKQGQASNLKLFGMDLFVTEADSQKAAEAIAPGGEYSVDAVAGRIMDMAKALAGGDESKISLLRGAVEKGFKAAGVDFGSKLPSICDDTHTEVMKRFDAWEKEASEQKIGETEVAE